MLCFSIIPKNFDRLSATISSKRYCSWKTHRASQCESQCDPAFDYLLCEIAGTAVASD